MANNPRKFSEKIALLNQKEQEGNAEFEKIMREVSNATSKMPQPPTIHNTNLIAMSPSAFLSRSLPNVNAPINTNLDNNNEEAAAASALAGLLTTSGYSNDINKSPNERSGSVGPQDKDLIKFPATNARESRGRSVGGGPMRSRSRNIDTSPYSSNNNAYLSPPTDSSWRRTSSDSAIHQSLTQAQDMHNNVSSLMLSPRAQKRISASQSNSMKNLHQQHLHHHHTTNNSGHQTPTQLNQQHSHSQQNMTMLNQQSLMQQTLNQQHLQMNNLQQDMKSRSVSRLPGISIYPSGNDDTLQIPIGNSTGSLPDLTLVHFQSPLSTPLDLEHDHQVTSSFNTNSSYSMPMASTNQTTNQLTNMGIYNNLDYSPKHYGTKATSSQGIQLENNSYNQQQQQQQTAPITIDQQQRHHQQQQQHQQHSPNHQSYPTNQMNEKLMSYRNTASPTNLSSSQGNLSKNSYRSTHNRPSPGSSPGVPGLTTNFDSNSSAPCSPSPQMAGINVQTFDTFPSVDSFYINPNSIQQHFEQFSLDWTSLVQVLVDSGCTISAEVKVDSPLPDYITSTTNDQNYSQMTENNFNGMMDDGSTANRNQQQQQQQQHSPTNRSNNNNSRTNSNNNNNNSNNNNNGHNNNNNSQNSPNNQNHRPNNANSNSNSNNNNNQHHQHHQQQHSPMNNDSLIGNNNYNSFNAALELALHENGVNDILLGGGMGSDSNSKLITSSSAALQTSISMMTSHASPQHLISTQTTTSIPEIIFSDYSSGSTDFARDIFCNEFELGSTELQMFENANIIADPTIEDSFRRDLY